MQGVGSGGRVVAGSLDVQETPVGVEADLPQGGQVGQPFADPEVAGVVDGGLGPQRDPALVVLPDRGVLVVDVQARGDSLGDDSGAEPARGGPRSLPDDPPVEDQPDLVRAADVEVVPDHLLEEDPPAHRLVQHLGEGELRLQDRHLVAVARGPVRWGERVRQAGQPLAQQRIDRLGAEPVADLLQGGHVGDGGEAVAQRREGGTGLGGLALGPVVAVDAQLGGVGEVPGELQEERPEVAVDAVEVPLVDHPEVFTIHG